MSESFETLREASIAHGALASKVQDLWRIAAGMGVVLLGVCGFFYVKLDEVSSSNDKTNQLILTTSKDLERLIFESTAKIDTRLGVTDAKLELHVANLRETLSDTARRDAVRATELRAEMQTIQAQLGNRGPSATGSAQQRR